MNDIDSKFKIQKSAIKTLQKVTEVFVVSFLSNMYFMHYSFALSFKIAEVLINSQTRFYSLFIRIASSFKSKILILWSILWATWVYLRSMTLMQNSIHRVKISNSMSSFLREKNLKVRRDVRWSERFKNWIFLIKISVVASENLDK